jgi:hypothetical protein
MVLFQVIRDYQITQLLMQEANAIFNTKLRSFHADRVDVFSKRFGNI